MSNSAVNAFDGGVLGGTDAEFRVPSNCAGHVDLQAVEAVDILQPHCGGTLLASGRRMSPDAPCVREGSGRTVTSVELEDSAGTVEPVLRPFSGPYHRG